MGIDLRIFITCLMPILQAELSSGSNIETNISQYPAMSETCKFCPIDNAAQQHRRRNEGCLECETDFLPVFRRRNARRVLLWCGSCCERENSEIGIKKNWALNTLDVHILASQASATSVTNRIDCASFAKRSAQILPMVDLFARSSRDGTNVLHSNSFSKYCTGRKPRLNGEAFGSNLPSLLTRSRGTVMGPCRVGNPDRSSRPTFFAPSHFPDATMRRKVAPRCSQLPPAHNPRV